MLSATRPDKALAPQRILLLAWWLVTALVALAGSAAALRKIVDHDVAYWIDAAGRLLDGAVLYRDLIELNPPTNYAITLVPVALARAAGLDAILTFHAFMLVLALLSAAMSAFILRRVLGDALPAAMMMLPLAFVFLILPESDFGQREHILGILILPYLLLAAARPSDSFSRALRAVAGVMAGVAVAYKPYFILYFVAAESLRLVRLRSLSSLLRTETVAVVTVVAAFALITVFAFPEYLRFIVPLGRATYKGFEQPLVTVLLRPRFLIAAAVTVAVLMLLRRSVPDSPERRCAAILAASAIAALVIYAVQMKGWRYHVLPAEMFAWTALGILFVSRATQWLRMEPVHRLAFSGSLALVVLVAAAHLFAATVRNDYIRADVVPLVDLVRREANGAPVLFLSTHLTYAFPVVNYAGMSWPYRYHHLLPLPGLYVGYQPKPGHPFRAPGEMGPIEAEFFATVVEDALRFQPRVILVDRRPQFGPIYRLGFDILAYFRQDPRFEEMFRNFRPAGRVSRHEVYIRRD